MDLYSLNFVIALVLATVVSVLLSRTRRWRSFAAIAVPAILYMFFYNYDYSVLGGVVPCIIGYVGAVVSVFFFMLYSSHERLEIDCRSSKKLIVKIPILLFLLYFGTLVFLAIPWALDTFPLSNVDAVLFTLFAGENGGAEGFVISSLISKVVFPSICCFVVVVVFMLVAAFALVRAKVALSFKLGKIKCVFGGSTLGQCFFQLQKGVLLPLVAICCCHLLLLPGIVLSPAFSAFFQIPVDSELYRNHYVHPDSVKVEALSDSPKNLIVIFLESMAVNYAQYTPEIVELEKTSGNFAPGGLNVAGTSWTIAGITGKLCGIPLNMPMGINEYHGKLPTYLPNAKCLMNVLADRGYNQVYMQGSSGDFTQKRTFWTVHGNVAVHDIEYYKGAGKIPNDYYVFWGFEDRKLYGFAKEELDSLAGLGKPFALYLLTVDTHQPEGYLDERCAAEFTADEKPFPKALRCASRQLGDFLAWAKEQSWYGNTVISAMGDHTMEMLSDKANVPLTDTLRWVNFILNSSIDQPVSGRRYSSLDMFPTLLEAMGFRWEGRAMGLGKSLYSGDSTVLELYGQKALDSLLRERSHQYDYFLRGE